MAGCLKKVVTSPKIYLFGLGFGDVFMSAVKKAPKTSPSKNGSPALFNTTKTIAPACTSVIPPCSSVHSSH